jgi:hypothetical protein
MPGQRHPRVAAIVMVCAAFALVFLLALASTLR